MERLTKRLDCGTVVMDCDACKAKNAICTMKSCRNRLKDRLAAYEDTGLEPEEIKEHDTAYIEMITRTYGPISQKIGQSLKAEREGRIVNYLPGDTVYDRFGVEWTVTTSEIHKFGDGALRYLYRCGHPGTDDYCALYADEILTREEAEAALAAQKGDTL